jgi:CAAX prenyl protease-like protein
MSETPLPAHPWLPYVAPMAAYLALTALEGYLPKVGNGPNPAWYASAYAAKVIVVAVVVWLCRSAWRDLKPWPGPGMLGVAIGLGLLIAVIWIGIDPYYPRFSFLGTRAGFDPKALPAGGRAGFLVARMFGLVVLVPLIEELFWRSFLMRWLVDPDFLKVPIGRVTPMAVAITSIFFAAEHPEWLPGLLTGLAWAWLVWRSKSVSACVISHAAANLGLGVHALATGDWRFL